MKHQTVRRLYTYWDDLRRERPAPYRSELDPRAIAPLLESTFVLEYLGPLDIRFRLAGTKLCDQFGLELRGMSALALWHGDGRDRIRGMLGRVVNDPVVAHVSATIETRDARLFDAEFLYMPLLSDFGEITRILGCGCYLSGEAAADRSLEPLHHWVDRVSFYQIAATKPAQARRVGQSESQIMRETLAAVGRARAAGAGPELRSIDGGGRTGHEPAETRRPHLRVVKRDD